MPNEPTTTFAKIRAKRPCKNRYAWALRKSGGLRNYGADTPITVRQIVETMGLRDALWCLRTMPEHNARWRLLALRYVRRVQHLMADPRSQEALEVAERYAHGLASDIEIAAARSAASVALRISASVTEYAAAYCAVAIAAGIDDDGDIYFVAAYCVAAARGAGADVAGADSASEAECIWQAAELIRICNEEI